MESDGSTNNDIGIKIQDTLIAISDITLKIKRELELIKELVSENGQLHAAVTTVNETLSRKAQEMEINMKQITNETKNESRLEMSMLDITSSNITERLLDQMDAIDM